MRFVEVLWNRFRNEKIVSILVGTTKFMTRRMDLRKRNHTSTQNIR